MEQRYKGIQTVFKRAGESACLFLSLMSIAEEYTGLDIDFIWAYDTCRDMNLIKKDFYCMDSEKILRVFTNRIWKKTVLKSLPERVPDNMYTIQKWYNDRTGFTHFRRRGFDTLESSVTVKEGYIKEYYCYEVEEEE